MKNWGNFDQLLGKKVTRRNALRSFGAMGVAPLAFGAGRGDNKEETDQGASRGPGRRLSDGDPALHRMTVGDMIADFDREAGTIHSIIGKGDSLGTNFLGNRINIKGRALEDQHWTGDIVVTAWHLFSAD